MALSPNELSCVLSLLAHPLNILEVKYAFCGSAALSLLREEYGQEGRGTDEIDIVVQQDSRFRSSTASIWLEKELQSSSIPTTRDDGGALYVHLTNDDETWIHVRVNIDLPEVWPPYDLDEVGKERRYVIVDGVSIPILGVPRLVERKIRNIFDGHSPAEGQDDGDDLRILLGLSPMNSVDFSDSPPAIYYILNAYPELRELLHLKVLCPPYLGNPWMWNDRARVYMRFEEEVREFAQEKAAGRIKVMWAADEESLDNLVLGDRTLKVWARTSNTQLALEA
ncbi:uncharacterized protein F4822DRAFT_414421 [Hypoxylon trugodes]|uniref:uncharacterized protein n=1 Tax=Hypoxylon trugodes TaxID=326681 RepID=UPI0021993AF3|nr:uncharacterized protein F4822DRAFT_414421 [Hypoxylon trugodes]KAI1385895.1 hypothetical protein F4822DRAFT_414421 [Hypoxylon trugodes]